MPRHILFLLDTSAWLRQGGVCQDLERRELHAYLEERRYESAFSRQTENAEPRPFILLNWLSQAPESPFSPFAQLMVLG